MNGPDPRTIHPMIGFPQICFIKQTITNPNISVGDYTYYDDPEDSEHFERRVLYHFPFIGDRLIIGKFCSIARGVTFIMNGANHETTGFSTYPFSIFGNGWERVQPASYRQASYKGDTMVGNDVWLGYEAVILPGVTIGDGAIIGAKAVVTRDVAPYTVVGGNPAQVIRQRFPDHVVRALLEIAWWDWDVAKISRNLEQITSADIEALRACV
ncbi:MAG: Vat family streptogramin A O-acetyltransferase [Chloroflexaceae bacterium]|nr:Vat family streptogramin A O-acetyltransferase [Chloroflexaceae bacterium]